MQAFTAADPLLKPLLPFSLIWLKFAAKNAAVDHLLNHTLITPTPPGFRISSWGQDYTSSMTPVHRFTSLDKYNPDTNRVDDSLSNYKTHNPCPYIWISLYTLLQPRLYSVKGTSTILLHHSALPSVYPQAFCSNRFCCLVPDELLLVFPPAPIQSVYFYVYTLYA